MTNQEISQKLFLMARLLEVKNANPFEVRAYQRAGRTIAFYPLELATVYKKEGRPGIQKISGIGKTIAGQIEDFIRIGSTAKFKQLMKATPSLMIEMMNVPGIGAKTAQKLFYLLKPKSLADLIEKMKRPLWQKRLAKASILDRSIEKILRGIQIYQSASGRILLSQALPRAESLVAQLAGLPGVKKVSYAGSLRRRKETVGDIDLALAISQTKRMETRKIIKSFIQLSSAKAILSQGQSGASIIDADGLQIDLKVVPEREWGSLLYHFTGSREHNIKMRALAEKQGFSFSEHGFRKINVRRASNKTMIFCPDEKKVFSTLKSDFIPPELREGENEFQLALQHRLPNLISLKDIRGDLQLHSVWSDGHFSIEQIVRRARAKGYEYILMTDHSAASLGITGGITEKNVRRYLSEIDQVNRRLAGIKVLKGIEVNIKPDGSLDQSDKFLSQFDLALGAVHSSFNQSSVQATRRLVRALNHPMIAGLVHPTTRIIDRRPPIQADWQTIFKQAARANKFLEINAAPDRLDLPDKYIRQAKKVGVKFLINTDAHSLKQLDYMRFGVFQARRAGLEKKDVINTRGLSGLVDFFKLK